MTTQAYRLLLGASLALFVGAAGAQNASDANSWMPAEKGVTHTMPAQPSGQATDKMSTAPQNAAEPTEAAPMRHAHKSAMHQMRHREAVSPEEKGYRQALRQCVKERNESQRDSCLDNAIEQHQPNS
jgi:hypothetical protein